MIPKEEDWIKALESRCGSKLMKNFLSATVAICGLGGIGSNIAVALARAGVGKLILIDFDIVDITNLHRQQYKANQIGMYKTCAMEENLREIAPYTKVDIYTSFLNEKNISHLLKDADIVCEAFDDAENKAILVNNVLENMEDKYIVASSGMAGIGSSNDIYTRRVSGKFYLCGDEKSDISEGLCLMSSRVMLCAAHQAHMVLRILAKEYEV